MTAPRPTYGPHEPGITGRLRAEAGETRRCGYVDATGFEALELADLLEAAIAAIVEARTAAMKYRDMWRDDPDLAGGPGMYWTAPHRLRWETPEE